MKKLRQAQKLTRASQKIILGQGSALCPPTGCYLHSVKDGNDRCFVLPCHTVYGVVKLVDGAYQCCF